MPSASEADAGNAKTNDPGDTKEGGRGTREDSKDAHEAGPAKPRSKKPLIILGAVVVVGAIIAFIIWFVYRNQVSTDDAYTDGNVITMAPKVSGCVVELLIDDNSRVRKGELLLRIEPQDFQTARAAALSQLALAKAQLKTAETDMRIEREQNPAQLVYAETKKKNNEAILVKTQASYEHKHEVEKNATTQKNIDTTTSQQLSSNAN